ncbi:MAG: rhomboid family intramembrane serine protease, partial [Proteobacteria bacterium]|nr:rhomboid family intramembrane serine protease [Pseudomonadota bacterium]
MLVLPVMASGQKNFPVVTLLLILANCFVLVFLQSGENKAYHEAYSFYQESGLARIELELYKKNFVFSGEALKQGSAAQRVSDDQLAEMTHNNEFQYQLVHRQVIKSGDQGYANWLGKRLVFEEKLGHVFSQRYGYSPARNNILGLFTCMFLHGGIMHLVGNMVFLWFVGSLLENGMGWRRYLPGYLATGVCASLLFGLVYPREMGPLVGASGAIAGLMGAYGFVFARAKIKIFYSLGFYFDYAWVPGWFLFPFWLLHEFFQLSTNAGSHVAYMAHVGGLLSGGLLGAGQMKFGDGQAVQMMEEKSDNKVPLLLEQGLEHFAQLEIPEARLKICQALEIAPDNRVAWLHLFNIDKCKPQSEIFQQTAHAFFALLAKDSKGCADLLLHIREYQRLGGTLRLTPELSKSLALAHVDRGELREAAGYLTLLLQKIPEQKGLPSALMRLA